MKVLIDSKYRAVMKGEYVKANEKRNEAIINSDEDITVAVLKEIAQANKVDIGGLKLKDDIHDALFKGLSKLEINEVSEKTDSDKVMEIVTAGLEAGKGEDDILVEIVNAGIKFSAAQKYYRDAMKQSGLYTSPKERKEQISKILTDMDFQPQTADEVKTAVAKIVEEVGNTTEKQARMGLNAWCKENEIDVPKVSSGGGGGKSNLRSRSMAWILENPNATLEEFTKHVIDDEGMQEKHANQFWPIVEFARSYAQLFDAD